MGCNLHDFISEIVHMNEVDNTAIDSIPISVAPGLAGDWGAEYFVLGMLAAISREE